MQQLYSPIKWPGGKGQMLGKILSLIPYGNSYIEPFGGGCNVLLNRAPSDIELYNDIDETLVNLFRVLQSAEHSSILKERIENTLYSRVEFIKALKVLKKISTPASLDVDLAWAFMVVQNMGFVGRQNLPTDWGRLPTGIDGSNRNQAETWHNKCMLFTGWHNRLKRVFVDSQDGISVLKNYDNEGAVFYCDPPYILTTRTKSGRKMYKNSPKDEWHEKFIDALLQCKGECVVSGYAHPIYERLTDSGWERIEWNTVCHMAGRTRESKQRGEGNGFKHAARTEVIWRKVKPNPTALF